MVLRPSVFLTLLCIFLHSNALPQFQVGTRAKGSVEAAPIAASEEDAIEDKNRAEGEPSCAQLKEMWRFSKRQSRAPEITNEIPTYRDPFAVNIWDDYARPRSAGRVGILYPRRQMVYGKMVHALPKAPDHSPERIKAFQDVFANREFNLANMQHHRKQNNFHRHGGGGGVRAQQPQAQGSFQHLKELIRNERARELQAQRTSDEERSGGKDSGKYPYGWLSESPPSSDNVIIRNKPVVGSRRMAGYPEMLMSARYFDDFNPYANAHVDMNRYKPQYADTSLGMDRESQWAW